MASIRDLMTGHGVISITPADSDLTKTVRAVYVGVSGDITIVAPDGTTALFKDYPQGKYLYQECLQVKATGTTATNLVGIY